MSAQDSGHDDLSPVEPIVQQATRAPVANVDGELVRLRVQLSEQKEDAAAERRRMREDAAAERQRMQDTVDQLQEQMAALARDANIVRNNAEIAARDRSRNRFSTVHTPFAPTRPVPLSTPFVRARATSPSSPLPKELLRTSKMPTFSGIRKKDQISLRDWLFALLTYLEAAGLHPETDVAKCIAAASLSFAPDVARWYRTEYLPSIKPNPVTWDFFVQSITDKYEPVPVGFTARTALKSIRQNGTIQEYNDAFSEVVSMISDMAEADKVDKYIEGLKQGLRLKVAGTLTRTLLESMTVAVQLEAAWANVPRDNRAATPFTRYHNRHVATPASTTRSSEATQSSPSPHLGRMSVADEYDDDDEKKQVPSHSLAAMQPARSFPPKLTDAMRAELQAQNKCFRCRQVGHVARQCKVYIDSKNE
jgi:hypothetical protein